MTEPVIVVAVAPSLFPKVEAAAVEKSFDEALTRLASAEKLSKAELTAMSRTVLEIFHGTMQIGFLNRFLGVLTPANRKMAIAYLVNFSGFHYNVEAAAFEKKNGKVFDACMKSCHAFLEDASNNIWTWTASQAAHGKPVAKPFSLDDVKANMTKALAKAAKADVKQVDVLRAVFSAGFTLECLMELLAENTPKETIKKEPTVEDKETAKKTTPKSAKKAPAGPPVKE